MTGRRVLIVSRHGLFAEAIGRIVQAQGCQVVGPVGDYAQAVRQVALHAPVNIIIDLDDVGAQNETQVAVEILQKTEQRQVILMSLAGNRVIAHWREHVENATALDLLRLLETEPKS